VRSAGFLCVLVASPVGCLAIVDADQFRGGRDATGDAADGSDAAGDAETTDADAAAGDSSPPDVPDPRILEVAPAEILEGERTVLLLTGSGLRSDDRVTVDGDLDIVEVTWSLDGAAAAVLVEAPIDRRLAAQEQAAATLAVERDAAALAEAPLTILGLDEVELSGDVDVGSLADAYSEVRILPAGIRLVGDTVATIQATASSVVEGTVDASAGPAPEAGPGGGRGGAAGAAGEGDRPGEPGDDGACPGTGGGASNRTPGEPGVGDRSGASPPAVVPTQSALFGLAGSGGGGGGIDGGAPGEPGGGGGGGVVLASRGEMTWTGRLAARGGDGRDSARPGCGMEFGGAGGGGSGGFLAVLSASPLRRAGPVDVSGGSGGLDGAQRGGAGGEGWVFVAAPGAVPVDGALRLPAWDPPASRVLPAGGESRVTLWGEPGHTLTVRLDDATARDVTPDAAGRAQPAFAVPAGVGRHRLCAFDRDAPAAPSACIEVVALP